MKEFDEKYVELFCKLNVHWYLETYEPIDWRNHGPYLTTTVNEDKEWYFDMGPGRNRYESSSDWSVGFAIGESDFYWLYPFNPEVKPSPLDETLWNHEEFKLMIDYFKQSGELEELYKNLRSINLRHPLPIDEKSYYASQHPDYNPSDGKS